MSRSEWQGGVETPRGAGGRGERGQGMGTAAPALGWLGPSEGTMSGPGSPKTASHKTRWMKTGVSPSVCTPGSDAVGWWGLPVGGRAGTGRGDQAPAG